MRILVLGGSGYVGHRVSERFLAAGHEVAVVSRGEKQPDVLGRVEHIQLDRKDHERFEAAMQERRFDAVIDTIAYQHEDALSAIRAFRGRVGQYLFISSVAVYSKRQLLRPILENDADLATELDPAESEGGFHPSGRLDYAIGKRAVERELQNHGADLPWTSLRAPIVVGPDDRTLRVWWFVQRIRDGGPLLIPDWGPSRIFQLVTADALAEAFLACAGNQATRCRAYNVAQAEILTAESWIDGLAAALGSSVEHVRVPESLLAAKGLPDYAMPIVGRPFGHVLLDISAARREFGFAPEPFETWVGATACGCAASPPSNDSPGYTRRRQEIEAARRYQALTDTAQRSFLSSGPSPVSS
jgi:nucleoside-diphosphate-sugar epimerase